MYTPLLWDQYVYSLIFSQFIETPSDRELLLTALVTSLSYLVFTENLLQGSIATDRDSRLSWKDDRSEKVRESVIRFAETPDDEEGSGGEEDDFDKVGSQHWIGAEVLMFWGKTTWSTFTHWTGGSVVDRLPCEQEVVVSIPDHCVWSFHCYTFTHI